MQRILKEICNIFSQRIENALFDAPRLMKNMLEESIGFQVENLAKERKYFIHCSYFLAYTASVMTGFENTSHMHTYIYTCMHIQSYTDRKFRWITTIQCG